MSDRPAIRKVSRGVYTCGHDLIACRHARSSCRLLGGVYLRWTIYQDRRPVLDRRTLRDATDAMGRILDRRAAAILKGEA